jgi:hypothetical protein
MEEAKRFGKLSIDHLRQLIAFVPILEQARPEFAQLIAEKPDKGAQLLKPGMAWGVVYDHTLVEQLACFLAVAGLTDYVVEASKSADPYAELLKLDDHPDYQEWDGGLGKQFEFHQLLGSLYALIGSFECLVLYGYYINDLLALVREQKDDDALFKAIRIDPGVMTSETAAHRISCAVVRGEKEFFQQSAQCSGRQDRRPSALFTEIPIVDASSIRARSAGSPYSGYSFSSFRARCVRRQSQRGKEFERADPQISQTENHFKMTFEMVASRHLDP